METPWHGLLTNFAGVALFTVIWTQFQGRISQRCAWQRSVLFGLIMGSGAVALMQVPVEFEKGFFLDLRSTMIAVSAFVGGPASVAITGLMAASYRLAAGGSGVWYGLTGMGISAAVGLAGHWLARRGGGIRIPHVVGLAFGVPAGAIGGLTLLPAAMWPLVFPHVAVPFVSALFLSTLFSGLMILQENRRWKTMRTNMMYRAIIKALPDCLNAKDLEGKFIAANPATADLMLAGSAAALIGRRDSDFYPAEVAQAFRRDEDRVLQDGRAATIEQKITRGDGRDVWLSTLKAPLRDDRGRPIGIITHNRDITEKMQLEQELRQVRETLDDAISNMTDGLVVYDRIGTLLVCNDRYRELFPLTADLRVPGRNLADIIRATYERGEMTTAGQDIDTLIAHFQQQLLQPQESLVPMADGRWFQVRKVAVNRGMLLLVTDISLKKRAEQAKEASAEEYRALFQNSVAGIFRSSPDGRLLRANPALARLNGFECEKELVAAANNLGNEWYVEPDRRHVFRRLMEAEGRVTDFVSEVYRIRSRERIWISESAWTVFDADQTVACYEGTIIEITERKRAEDALAQANETLLSLARTDGLTGLANRRAFDERLARECVRARQQSMPLSLVLIDVDRFKRFNDTYGHVAGDDCLRRIGRALQSLSRGSQDLACRYGGEELALILPNTPQQEAHAIAERFGAAIADLRLDHAGSEHGHVTVSMGTATLLEGSAQDMQAFVTRADRALYRAKSEGRNRVVSMQAA